MNITKHFILYIVLENKRTSFRSYKKGKHDISNSFNCSKKKKNRLYNKTNYIILYAIKKTL